MAEEDKKRRFSQDNILPPFDGASVSYDAKALFCYFLDEVERPQGKSNIPLVRYKKALIEEVTGEFNEISAQLALKDQTTGKASEQIQTAVDFIAKAAKSERIKEMRVIHNYLDEIKNNSVLVNALENKTGKKFNEIISEMDSYAVEDPSEQITENDAINKLINFYDLLTILINDVKQKLDEFKRRIEQLSTRKKDFKEISGGYFAYRLPSDIDRVFSFMQGMGVRDSAGSFSYEMGQQLLQYIAKSDIIKSPHFIRNPMAAVALLIIDFEKFINNHYAKQFNYEKFDEFALANLNTLFDDWIQQQDSVMQRLRSESDEILDDLIDSLSNTLGIKLATGKALQRRSKRASAANSAKGGKNKSMNQHSTAFRPLLKKFMGLQSVDQVQYITTNVSKLDADEDSKKTSTYYGYINEHLWALIQQGFKVSGSAAADVIQIGRATADFSISPEIWEQTKKLSQAFTTLAAKTLNDRKENLTDELDQMNNEMQEVINDLQQQLVASGDLSKDLFVYHESLKLYSTLERTNSEYVFKGRNLKILTAIQYLYDGINNFNTDGKFLDITILQSAALNLADQSQGADLKDPVANYFSIFAGLLMFDDIRQMALDAQKTLTTEIGNNNAGVYQIHLYQTNGVFVPGSYLLSFAAQAFQAGESQLESTNHAVVHISTSQATKSINEYMIEQDKGAGYNKEQDWITMANQVAKDTSITITFLQAFTQFMNRLKEYFS